MSHVVIVNHSLPDSPRAVIHEDALPEHEGRGWEVVGLTSNPLRLTTDSEQAALDAAEDRATTERVARIESMRQAELVAASTEPPPEASAVADEPEPPQPARPATATLKEQ